MNQLNILLKKDLMDLYRSKKILVLLIVFILFAILSPALAAITPDLINSLSKGSDMVIKLPDPTYLDAYVQFFKNATQMCSFVLVIVYASLIVEERSKGTYATLINNNVKPSQFVLSKLITEILVFTIIYVISVIIFLTYTTFLFDKVFAPHYLIAFASYYFYIIFLIGIINFASALTKTTVMSIAVSFMMTFGIMIFDLLPRISRYFPDYLINISNNVITSNKYLSYFWPDVFISLGIVSVLTFFTIRLCRNIERL